MTAPPESATAVAPHADEPIIRLRHPGRWVAAALLLVLAAMFVNFVFTSPRLRLDLVAGYLFERSILQGLLVTLELTVVAMLVGVVLGIVLAVMRLSENPVLRRRRGLYVWFFRGTPVLVQLAVLVQPGTLLPGICLGIPFGPDVRQRATNHADHAVRRGDPGPGTERGRVHGRDRPRRHRLGRPGPDRGGRRRWA